MCSTFKWVLAGLVLEQSEKGQLAVSERLSYAKADVVPHSPVTGPRLAEGGMTIAELCGATVVSGDNTAANLLLRKLGGPEEFTAALRVLGDRATRLDRWEIALNENAPGDVRDTTTPEAMVRLLRSLLIGPTLSTASRGTLMGWMEASTTGLDRLRAGLPIGWRVGDKTGAGGNGANNDVAFAIAPAGGGERGLLIASYISAPAVSQSERNAVHRMVAEQAVERLLR
jgi:beta-lactamase class A